MVRYSHVGDTSKTMLEEVRSSSDVLLQIAPTGLRIEPLLPDHTGAANHQYATEAKSQKLLVKLYV